MSNPEKTRMDTEVETNENSDDSDYLWSDEEGEIREIVCALPALRVSESPNVDEIIRNEAVVAAQLVVEAAEEAVGKKTDQIVSGSRDVSGNPNTKQIRRPRVLIESLTGASISTAVSSSEEKEPIKKKKNCSILTNPPPGTPKCNVCGRLFNSWKAVFGHLRSHKDRGYLGFLPPPTFNAAEEFAVVAAATSVRRSSGLGTGGIDIDLNADPVEEEEERTEPKSTLKIDLNRSPPQDEEVKGKEDN